MRQITSNFLNMVQAVLAILKNDKAAWENEPLVVSKIAEVEGLHSSVTSDINSVSGLNQKGYTIDKNNTFDSIMNLTLTLCKRLSAYARKFSNNSLLLLTDHSSNSLSKGIEKDAISRCSAIVNMAESLLPQLQDYKVTVEDLSAIRNLINDYNGHINNRSVTKTDKSTMKLDIEGQISLLRAQLNELDDLVEGFIDDKDVIVRYKNSRSILDYGKSKTAKKKPGNTQA